MNHGSAHGAGGERQVGPVAPLERVRITYRPRDAGAEVELPLRLLLLGDFTQRPDPRPLAERQPIAVDKDSLNAVTAQQRLTLSFTVEDTMSGQPGRELPVLLRFRRITDMEPEAVAKQVPQVKALLELREALTPIKTFLGALPAFRKRLQRYLEDPASLRRLREEIGLPVVEGAVIPRRGPAPALAPEAAAAREEARCATAAEVLTRLAEHPEPEVRAAVAGNPDTPPDVLFRLARYFPAAFARNPVLPLLAIERTDWLSHLQWNCVAEVVRHGLVTAPEVLLAQVSRAPDLFTRQLAAADPRTPAAVLSELAQDSAEYVRSTVASNPSLPVASWLSLMSDPAAVVNGARYPHAPVSSLRAAAASPNHALRAAVAAHPSLPGNLLAPLAHDGERAVRHAIAARSDLPASLAAFLAADPEPWVRGRIAANPAAPADLLPALADDSADVRNGLLGNRNVPPELRERVCARNRAEWLASDLAAAHATFSPELDSP